MLSYALHKQAEYAPGIQQRDIFGDPTALQSKDLVKFFLQEHHADVAGKHFDLRLGDKNRKLYSWAVPKGLPEPKQKHFAKQTFLHDEGYGGFSGRIGAKYGRGRVYSRLKGSAYISKSDDNGITFFAKTDRGPERFRLQKLKNQHDWLLINATPEGGVDMTILPNEVAEEFFKNG